MSQPALADLAEVPARSRWVRAGALRLHLLDYGPSDGTPVLILPGITSPAVTMDFVARRLTDLVRPLVLDVRGRGLSDNATDTAPLHGYDLASYAADVDAVIAELDLRRPILVGHSMGARIAAVAAANHRLRGTVLVDPPMSGPGRDPYPTSVEAFLAQLDEARGGTDADAVSRFWPRWPRPELEKRARWLASCSRTAVAATHTGFETEDFFTHWPAVSGPTTLIYGGGSPVVVAAGVAEAAAANPTADLVCVPGAGHMVFWDEPESGTAALRDALRKMT
ncbi:alpha/beta fold hydrolase [Saccharopolyspora mangrovi]|uniref:Alpha/beta hydrolase n=1 Tax=Saccharopolyspora mangrovi TaxID=3082379 RepID=A0ABU6AHK2_9PSEU|nr:alpha/beta hydrolase [Saccharopolyspora sp. S2-29]MEB3370933.1 alpha/beta hydrolase [Saccharopolyspora sp. S2-29]